MPRKGISDRNRREVLKLAAVSAGGITVTPTVSAKANQASDTVRTIKTSIQNPIKEKHIERKREAVLNQLANRDDAPQSVIFDGKPVQEDKVMVGYALAIENGAPVERKYNIPENLLSTTGSGSFSPASEVSNASQVAFDMEKAHHASIDDFVSRHGGDI